MKPFKISRYFFLLVAVIIFSIIAGPATAQTPPPEKNTVYVIGNMDGMFDFPVLAYSVVGNDIQLAGTINTPMHDMGSVGLAFDRNNEHLMISFEAFNGVEVIDTSDGSSLGAITLWGTDNIAGMVVHQDRGHLYVVDRREQDVFVFDTTTFALVEQWVLPTGIGAYGIDLWGDWLFVTSPGTPASPYYTVHYYDIDTHAQVGSFTVSHPVAAIAVTDYPEPLVFLQGHNGSFGTSPYFIKYALNSGVEELLTVGSDPKGVTLNPATELAYSVVDNLVRVIDTATMSILHTEQLHFTWNPSDIVATAIPIVDQVQKTCTTHPDGNITKGDTVKFNIQIQNRYALAIRVLSLSDTYDSSQLTFVSATLIETGSSLAPSINNPGYLEFANLIVAFGNYLPPGEYFNVRITFKVAEDCNSIVQGTNTAMIFNVEDILGESIPDASGQFDYEIDCLCYNNLDCDDGMFCNGVEVCLANGQCDESPGNPCPIDDGIWCNGTETDECIEGIDECGHENEPCKDDGQWCNGSNICDEDNKTCTKTDPPCITDGLFCNGGEFCNEVFDKCEHGGNPCNPGQQCNEKTDECVDFESDDDDNNAGPDISDEDDDEGGCCG